MTFGNKLAGDLHDDKHTKETRAFPPELRRAARRKLLYIHDASDLRDLRSPPGNRLEALKGKCSGHHSLRLNDQWRVMFRWTDGEVDGVRIIDDH